MSSTRTCYLLTGLLLALAAIEPSSANVRTTRSEAFAPLASAQDYRHASEESIEQARRYRRLSETQAACEELARSLDYYRMALAKENPLDLGLSANEEGDGMKEIRSDFGCTHPQLG